MRSWLVLRLLCVSLCVSLSTHNLCDNCITYIVAMQPYFTRIRQFRWLICVAAMSSLAQYEFEMDTAKQRQHRHYNARLTKSGNARSKQLLVMPIE